MKKPTHQLTRSGNGYVLITDNAEFIHSSVHSAALNHKLEHAKPCDGVAKAVIESSFRILQVEWGTLIRGYVHTKSDRRDGPDYRLDAALAVEDLRK